MENDGLRFYQIFNFGGLIGVNQFSFGELVAVNAFTLVIMIVLIGLLAAFFPLLMLLFYVIFLLMGNWPQNDLDRARTNLAGIVGYIYFMLDYHFGFIGWSFITTLFSKETLDTLCYFNTTLFVVNVILLFYGAKFFGTMPYGLLRVSIFIGMLYFGHKIISPISQWFIPKVVPQHVEPPKKAEKTEKQKEEEFRYNEDYYNEIYGIDKK